MGAADGYPDGEADDELFAERVEEFHAQQAREAHTDVDTRDRRTLTRVLTVIWIVDLAVIVAGALVVLLASADLTAYEAHRDRFFVIAAIGTVIYFLAAYGELRRRTAHTRRMLSRHDDSSPAGSRPAG